MRSLSWFPFLGLLALSLTLGCSDDSSGDGATGGSAGTGGGAGMGGAAGGEGGDGGSGPSFSADPPLVLAEDTRPASVTVPSDYDPEVTYPLLISLHGAGVNGRVQAGFFRLISVVDQQQFVLVYPDGINSVWNATDACCDPTQSVDDVGYISSLIEEALATYNTDPRRVYLMGHSNGAFLSFRMACERSDLITGIVALAGATFENPEDCTPSELPVSALVVHGTDDPTVLFDGGDLLAPHPSAPTTVERVATRAGCDLDDTTMLESLDLFEEWAGPETDREVFNGCDDGLAVEFWTLQQAAGCTRSTCNPHIPVFNDEWATRTTDWLFRLSR